MTPLGLFVLEEPELVGCSCWAVRLRAVLRAHFRQEANRAQPISYPGSRLRLGIERGQLTFALTHLTDALIVCAMATRPHSMSQTRTASREGVLDDSVFDVARAARGLRVEVHAARHYSIPFDCLSRIPSTHRVLSCPSLRFPPRGYQYRVAMISYSHDSQAHKDWVRALAERLTKDGIKVVLDQWHLSLGMHCLASWKRASRVRATCC